MYTLNSVLRQPDKRVCITNISKLTVCEVIKILTFVFYDSSVFEVSTNFFFFRTREPSTFIKELRYCYNELDNVYIAWNLIFLGFNYLNSLKNFRNRTRPLNFLWRTSSQDFYVLKIHLHQLDRESWILRRLPYLGQIFILAKEIYKYFLDWNMYHIFSCSWWCGTH